MKKLNSFFLLVFLFFSSFYFGTPALERYFHNQAHLRHFQGQHPQDDASPGGDRTVWIGKTQKKFKRFQYVPEKLFFAPVPGQAASPAALYLFALLFFCLFSRPVRTARLRAPPAFSSLR